MRLVNSAGKPISLDGLDDGVANVLTEAFGGLTAQIAAATTTTLKPLEESIASISTQLEALPKVQENPSNSNTGKAGDAGEVKSTDPVLQALADQMTEISKRLEANETASKADQESKASAQVIEEYFKANHPNMRGKDAIMRRIAGVKPKTAEEVAAAIEAEKKYMTEIHGEESVTKMFAADSKAEGGKEGQADETEAEEKDKIEAINSKLKQV